MATTDRQPHHTKTYKKLIIAALIGVVAALATIWLGHSMLSPLVAWDAAALAYIVWVWLVVRRLSPEQTKSHAAREDPGRTVADVVLIIASVASLIAVIFLILHGSKVGGGAKLLDLSLGLTSVVISWLLVHTLYTLKYARLFYNTVHGEVNFNEQDLPQYSDFAYLAFTLGMTYQVSDTNLKSKEIRIAALHHALLSYLFGTVIIATTINVLVSLSS